MIKILEINCYLFYFINNIIIYFCDRESTLHMITVTVTNWTNVMVCHTLGM